MRKSFLILISFSMVLTIHAQKKNVSKALSKINSGKLAEAYELLQPALENPESKDDSKTWYALGLLYQKAEMLGDQSILSKTDSALKVAYDNFNKARKLDEKGERKQDISNSLKQMYDFCINQGNANFTRGNYAKASEYFGFSLTVNNDPDFPRQHDTIVALLNYYTGLSAYYGALQEKENNEKRMELFKRAEKYYEDALKMNYKDDFLYRSLHYSYLFTGDTTSAEKVILKGFENYPDSVQVIIDVVNLYISMHKYDKVLLYLDPAIAKMPGNAQLVYTKAQMYDQMNKWEEAEQNYKKAIEMKPDYYEAYYNLGVLYYNWATDFNNQAATTDLKQQEKYAMLINKRDEYYKKSLEPFKKAYEIKKSAEVLQNLKRVYNKLKMKKELEEVNQLLEKM